MFTGLVESVGDVVALAHGDDGAAVIEVASPLAGELSPGDSVAVSGACLTARAIDGDRFRADIVSETLRRTTLGELAVGSKVNLELPLRASDRLGGHIVLGHVDGVGEVRAQHESGEIEVEISGELSRYVVEKGSIALDGVSLTVAALDGDTLTVALIPATLAATTLGEAGVGRRLNVEVDILAKHVERLVVR
ncbi:MAG TPA: riboflavin synthase [Solirubrobacteraceae bacterium]|jgi:riboflavin synthase|nr:riboflavin synthase [Solirubrobacteraceae bacterium]